ncbi:MAG TPA: hypothetical protein PLK68_15785, partial [Thomasclavelia ramosa]|nr:hypothetical protein [Thomasclavelia ramosa]
MFLEKIYVVSESGIADVLAVIIPTLTSIIGFIVTYRIAKKQISKELDADKKRTALENGKEILSYCAKMLDFKWYKSPECLNEINEMMNKVIAYGSRDAIAILSAYQQYNYTHNFNEKKASQ